MYRSRKVQKLNFINSIEYYSKCLEMLKNMKKKHAKMKKVWIQFQFSKDLFIKIRTRTVHSDAVITISV